MTFVPAEYARLQNVRGRFVAFLALFFVIERKTVRGNFVLQRCRPDH